MTITDAGPCEAETLTQIALAAKGSWGYPEEWMTRWRPLLTITPASIATDVTFVARSGSRSLGFAALSRQADALWLKHLWVLPEAMGQGVGRALFTEARQRARAGGFDSFDIESDPNAVGFYKRMGAEQIATTISMLDGQERHLPILRFRLGH